MKMKRIIAVFITLIILIGCASVDTNVYQHALFDVVLPDGFERVLDAGVLCFAPHGDPLLSSSITFYMTELNWYFDRFTDTDYETALRDQCGYEDLTVESVQPCRIDGYEGRRVACKVAINQGVHDLIIYIIQADQCYIFTLLNRDTDTYVDAFDSMMKTIRWKGNA